MSGRGLVEAIGVGKRSGASDAGRNFSLRVTREGDKPEDERSRDWGV